MFWSGRNVAQALQQLLAQLETHCHAHAQAAPQFAYDDEGYLFTATGDRAFIFARLFLALERDRPTWFRYKKLSLVGK